MNAVDEQIRLYAKQLKIPSFAEYPEVLRQADPSAGFPYLKTIAYAAAKLQPNRPSPTP